MYAGPRQHGDVAARVERRQLRPRSTCTTCGCRAAEGADAAEGEMLAVLGRPAGPGHGGHRRGAVDRPPPRSTRRTADETILVPGRIVGMDVSDGGPHVNDVYVAEDEGRDLAAADDGAPVALARAELRRLLRPAAGGRGPRGGRPRRSTTVGIGMAPEYFLVMTEEGGFFAEADFAALFTSLATAQDLAGRPGPGQRPGAHPALPASTRTRRPQPWRPRSPQSGTRPRRDRHADRGRGRLPGALRRHRERPALLEHLRRR